MAQATNHRHKPAQKRTWKPLNVEQENAIGLLVMGKTDMEVCQAVGIGRTALHHWRHHHLLFRATLEQRRAEIWRAPQEKLRSLLMRAVENVAGAIEAGNVQASFALLRLVGMTAGPGLNNDIGEQDPDRLLRTEIESRIDREAADDPRYQDPHLRNMAETLHPEYAHREQRSQAVRDELEAEYLA